MISADIQDELVKSVTDGILPIDTRNVWQWAYDNVSLPASYAMQGTFDAKLSPYLLKPFESLTDNSIRQINLVAATQTGKTLLTEVYTPYVILQSPAPLLKIHQSDQIAQLFTETRLIPLLKNNPDIKRLLQNDRYSARKSGVVLPHMFFKACGPSENNLHGVSIKTLMLDEVWLYTDETIVEKAVARTTAFNNSKKIIITSQPDSEGTQLHKEYMKGDIFHYGFRCPSCQVLQQYEFQGEYSGSYYGLVWSANNKEKTLTYDERTNDTKLVCRHCFHQIIDTTENRRKLVDEGEYIQIQSGDSSIKSYSWSAYVNTTISFKQIAMQYINAKQLYKTTGVNEKLKLFRNQVLGLFWKKGELIDTPKLLQDITVTPNDKWADETNRFMVIDVQQNCMYWLILAGSNKVSEARLIDWGIVAGYDELVEIRKKYNVHPLCVAIDSGNDTRPIYKESVQRGEIYQDRNGKRNYAQWLCLKGDGGKFQTKITYPHKMQDGTIQDRFYSVETRPDCQWQAGSKYQGIRAKLILWSNYSVKTLLTNIRDGRVPFQIKYNDRADATFTKQMYSEQLNPKTKRYECPSGVDNHIWDCMCMAVVMLLMSKCFVPAASEVKQITDTSIPD